MDHGSGNSQSAYNGGPVLDIMATNKDYLAYVKGQLEGMGDLDTKNMFGGTGLFHQGLMFGMIANDVLRFKADATISSFFEEAGMKPFTYKAGKKPMPYWEVPVNILEDSDQLISWAMRSYQVALKTKKK